MYLESKSKSSLPHFHPTHLTKEELLYLMSSLSELFKKLSKTENVPRTRMVPTLKVTAKRDLIFEIFTKLIDFYKVADRMVTIEGSQTNLKCLLVSANMLSVFFLDVFSKLLPQQIESDFIEFHVAHQMTQCGVEVGTTLRIVSDVAKQRHAHHVEVKKACQEQKAFRESFLKTQTDFDIDFEDHEADQEIQLLSIEDAVLIIQKLERKYQAISRRNYVRFVRERAAELHGQKVEIDATQAAIRIQARTRGYFARKQVREMRDLELNQLNMTPESYIRAELTRRERRHNLEVSEAEFKIQQADEVPSSLEATLEQLKSTFFLSTEDAPEAIPLKAPVSIPDTVFRDACFRGIVSPLASIPFDELKSQTEICRIASNGNGVPSITRQFKYDLRSFLSLSICIPMSLATWKTKKEHFHWLLISGHQESGKTAWARAIARACQVTHVHISKNVVNLGKRRIYTVIKKLAKQEKRLLISIDRIDVLKKDPKHKGYTHRQILLRNFLTDLSSTSATVIGMTKILLDDLESSITEYFPFQVALSNPSSATRYDLAVNCLSRNMEQDRLPKIPQRIFDLEKQTIGFAVGKTSKFVTNRWSAANNKTNLS